nr:UDP-N-acetylhexosamine pyrophosphorylase-like [Leptinotarsa decemlineata]XP_023024178.1 UDP-N-acetylhexosamine pyrophosphorylase-like [Leptinotarsa decemlineata]XP_023024179.1 UDP-N-acetylhexosamine pyrophosphorylase-like [Leptinotarsa decemlineata]
MFSFSEIEERLVNSKQEHLLQHWGKLTSEERECFLQQLSAIDFEYMNEIFWNATNFRHETPKKLDTRMSPIPSARYEVADRVSRAVLAEYRTIGLKEISEDHVAVILLAGGQGTRLGVTYPKGMFPIDIPSGKTLFQLQAERIRRVIELAEEETGRQGKICWYIMTSAATHESTANYLEKHEYFGIHKEDVVLFQQASLPCFTFSGKIILEKKDSIALAPDGNGGIYEAMQKHKIVADMQRRGVKYVHVYSVDNILVKVADPEFIGYCVKKEADCGVKVIPKRIPNEPVGVVCEVDGVFQVVEYSEISEVTASQRNRLGELVFNAGNICNHLFTTDFLENMSEVNADELDLHVAQKKIPFIGDNLEIIRPTDPNGIKIEKFIFDAFKFSLNFVVWEVPRCTDFSPLKNCDNTSRDCPATCRRDLLKLHKRYVQRAGGVVVCDELEISPLLSYAGENLEEIVRGKQFFSKTLLVSKSEQSNNES